MQTRVEDFDILDIGDWKPTCSSLSPSLTCTHKHVYRLASLHTHVDKKIRL